MMKKTFVAVDIHNQTHCVAIVTLLNDYMEDEMGISKSMPNELGSKIVEGLKKHNAYLGFFVCVDNEYVALANCNLNYSTWQANFLINIHDFIVTPTFRKQGVGEFLLKGIESFAMENGYCKLNLEVRNDNFKAKKLYAKKGFEECNPSMLFWQKVL